MARRLWFAILLLGSCGCVRLSGEPNVLECYSSADCPPDLVCLDRGSAANTCRKPGYCQNAYDCDGIAVCRDYTCTQVECTSSSDGCGTFACDGYSNTCYDSCTSDYQCASSSVCATATGTCIVPTCGPGLGDCGQFACVDGTCRTSCVAADDCIETAACLDGLCVTTLKANGEACVGNADCLSENCCAIDVDGGRQCADVCGELKCTGTPKPCAERSEDECFLSGCEWDYVGECQGPTFDCSQFSACPVGYCFYDDQTYPSTCSGTTSCSEHDSEYSCSYYYLGGSCKWVEYGCQGTPYACETHDAEYCESNEGCVVDAVQP